MGANQTWIDRYVNSSTANRLGEALFARYNIFSESEEPELDDAGVISAIMTDLDEYSEEYADMVDAARVFYSASALDDTKRNISDAVADYNSTARQAAKREVGQRDETEAHEKIKPCDETVSIDGLYFGISCSNSNLTDLKDCEKVA